MLDEGVRAGFEYLGIRSRTILYAERETYPVAVLAARMEEGSLDAAPIWFGDLTELPAGDLYGKVDCVAAGFPCQDLSIAGRRAGLDGKRSGLFFEVTRIADDCGAWLVFLENVAGIATATATVMDEAEGELDERAAARVLGELADLGWNAEWVTISASDVGASHGRARWFCLAWRTDDADRPERRPERTGIVGRSKRNDTGRPEAHSRAGIAIEVLAHPESDGTNGKPRRVCQEDGRQRGALYEQRINASSSMGNTEHTGLHAAEVGIRLTSGNDGNATWPITACELARPSFADGEVADAGSIRNGQGNLRSGKQSQFAIASTDCEQMADPGQPRPQGNKQPSAHEPDGRTDGARIMPTNCRISS